MASNGGTVSTLSAQYDKCLEAYTGVKTSTDSTNQPEYQSAVSSAVSALEDLTREVSRADLFSRNESADELPTESLKFLLLPHMLGDLTCRTHHHDRLQVISTAEVYYRDFLQRCRDYGLTDTEVPQQQSSQEPAPVSEQPRPPTMRDLATMSKKREERLKRYRQQKQLEERLTSLQAAVARPGADEETVRDYYSTLLQRAVGEAVSELHSLQLEKPILEHMQQLKQRGGSAAAEAAPPQPAPPLRPVVITRARLEAAVFGPGYSSLPTLSVEEFHAKRVADGTWPAPTAAGGAAPAPAAALRPDGTTDDDAQAAEQDRRRDAHDEAEVRRARAWDEYRDSHRRGEGNRYNRS